MASLLPVTKLMFLGNDGKPLVGGKVYTYDSGTTNPRTTYQDAAGLIPNSNPVILDARGEALIFWSGSYRVKLTDSLDTTIWTVDSVSEIILNYRTGSNGSAIIPYGTTGQRDIVPQIGYLRYNLDSQSWEGYGTAGWGNISGGGSTGSTGAGGNNIFVENDEIVTTAYTIGSSNSSNCSISIASPAVITQSNSYVGGETVFFSTTGALPTGLNANARYYVLTAGLSTSGFRVALTAGGAAINTTGSQSGTQKCGKLKNASTVGPLTLNAAVTVIGRLVIQ